MCLKLADGHLSIGYSTPLEITVVYTQPCTNTHKTVVMGEGMVNETSLWHPSSPQGLIRFTYTIAVIELNCRANGPGLTVTTLSPDCLI
jgi:hypothetical protein